MEIIIILLLFLFGFGSFPEDFPPYPDGAPTEVPAAPDAVDTFRSPVVIETVELQIMESSPPQYALTVTGYNSDGCDYPVQVEQRQEGNILYIDLFRVLPISVMCAAVIVPYNETISLQGEIVGGQFYTVIVNEFVQDFQF